jgi:alkylhydroperoxidase family enzyme
MGTVEIGRITFDIAARQAHVVGAKPRIAALPNDGIDQASRDIVTEIRAGAGAGPIEIMPEYMRMMLKHPELFRRQMEMGALLYNGKLPPRERELAILRCGWLLRAPYEWGAHVNIGKRVGLSAEEVARVTEGSSAAGWNDFDRAVLRGVEELVGDAALSDATWTTLAKHWDEAQLLEFPMMVGQYVATAFVQNSLRVRLDDDNPGLSHR